TTLFRSQRADWSARSAGLPESPRHGAFVSVSQQVLDAMHEWRAVEAVASDASSAVEGRTVTTTVTAADGGDVAGTVTFTGGDWSETVALVGGVATVEGPRGVTEVVASYDGYRDGLVEPSTANAVQLESGSGGSGAGGAGADGAGADGSGNAAGADAAGGSAGADAAGAQSDAAAAGSGAAAG